MSQFKPVPEVAPTEELADSLLAFAQSVDGATAAAVLGALAVLYLLRRATRRRTRRLRRLDDIMPYPRSEG